MASVYYLFDDAIHLADDIVQEYSKQQTNLKENHYAATIIQRTYRGYLIRKSYKKHLEAIIVFQKYTRGWLVRYHLPDRLHEFWDSMCLNAYSKAAAKLQAVWKGYKVRQEIDIKKIMQARKMSEHLAKNMDDSSLDSKSSNENKDTERPTIVEDLSLGGVPLGKRKDLIQRIMELMFDRHHLLSTQIHQGVLQGSSELMEIEKIIKNLPWSEYMKKMRKLYYKHRESELNKKCTYIFTDKRMQYQEDLLKLRDKSRDIKDNDMGKCIADMRPPFNLSMKCQEAGYQKSLLSEGHYIKRETNIQRTEDKSKNISDQDFVLVLKQIVNECNIPPYYADFWYQECIGHHFVD
ncbi:unconventional myosin-Vc [Dendroctonus ponderosae]|uniref:unconventional myosin-Vc n=1 Tax=Dendroctonus ponderosae TaxID=77166 RepID=UPI0020362716|nr:unconventional myosin-Vc [Dendroctonus ponderosae]KAH1010136.1 hypothetical protein HUJ05_004485 [Dendroctonus ponderosae]